MMNSYESICIGGSKHGERIVARSPKIQVAKDIMPIPVQPYGEPYKSSISDMIKAEQYEWETFHFPDGNVSYWRHESIRSHKEAIVMLLDEAESTRKIARGR